MVTDGAVIDWLLDSDPALRGRSAHLVGRAAGRMGATRARITTEVVRRRPPLCRIPTGSGRAAPSSPPDFGFDGPEAAEGAGR